MSVRTLIVDDEPLARRNIRSLLKSHSDFEIVGECGSGMEALETMRHHPIDLLFLDVQMPELDGFQVLERIDSEKLPAVVFVTAYEEHAIRAFEVSAVDYLLKPVDDKRFEQALSRSKAMLARQESSLAQARLISLLERREEAPYCRRFLIRTNSRVYFVPVEEIDYIEAEDYYSALHVGAKTHLLREPIRDLAARLNPKEFVRIHRSAIVNVQRIKELRALSGGGHVVCLTNGTTLRLSRSRWDLVKRSLAIG